MVTIRGVRVAMIGLSQIHTLAEEWMPTSTRSGVAMSHDRDRSVAAVRAARGRWPMSSSCSCTGGSSAATAQGGDAHVRDGDGRRQGRPWWSVRTPTCRWPVGSSAIHISTMDWVTSSGTCNSDTVLLTLKVSGGARRWARPCPGDGRGGDAGRRHVERAARPGIRFAGLGRGGAPCRRPAVRETRGRARVTGQIILVAHGVARTNGVGFDRQ